MEQRRPLFGVKGVVRSTKERENKKFIKKVLTRAGIVRDIAYDPNASLYSALNWTDIGGKICVLSENGFDIADVRRGWLLKNPPDKLATDCIQKPLLRKLSSSRGVPGGPASFHILDFY